MKLLVDMGNSRVKWQLRGESGVTLSGAGALDELGLFRPLRPLAASIAAVAVSTVASEAKRASLCERLGEITQVPVQFFWTESRRGALRCVYADPQTMGVDRWHALYGAWLRCRSSFAVVDAGSAITIDFVSQQGEHLGGYILPGKRMMLRSLRQDAARIGFGAVLTEGLAPGASTTECVHHGLRWLWRGMAQQMAAEADARGLEKVFVTGGDALELMDAGLEADHVPDLVLAGLVAIVEESFGS
ncbi:type III pantothenate kinase [Marinobacter sp. SS21]|uniref:type III pantothenate kinase n=1 Tax=Marinobacter sp. SS21 TaxID=2979460 RepID=UPI00232D1D5E|nr:type III pantothenate kinase [Marinobacter sp. SS21]MDC0663252.1 type III pantothenate kinase [Marinobacter sp. SS21]